LLDALFCGSACARLNLLERYATQKCKTRLKGGPATWHNQGKLDLWQDQASPTSDPASSENDIPRLKGELFSNERGFLRPGRGPRQAGRGARNCCISYRVTCVRAVRRSSDPPLSIVSTKTPRLVSGRWRTRVQQRESPARPAPGAIDLGHPTRAQGAAVALPRGGWRRAVLPELREDRRGG